MNSGLPMHNCWCNKFLKCQRMSWIWAKGIYQFSGQKSGTWLWPFWKESPAGIATQTVCIFVQIDRILLSLSEKWPKPPLANSRIRNMPEMHDLLCLVWKRVFWYIFNFSQKFNFYKTLIFDILQFLRKKLDDFLVYFTKKKYQLIEVFCQK